MIQVQVKLRLTPKQERTLIRWMRHLTSVWNWAVIKMGNDARHGIYYSLFDFKSLLVGHGKKIGISQNAIYGTVATAHNAWSRCFKRLARKPRLKGRRNKLNSIAFAHGTRFINGRLVIPGVGRVRFYKQQIPEGHIGQFRVIKRPSGFYACLSVHSARQPITATSSERIGLDSGFRSLLTLSTGEKVEHPREFHTSSQRLAQAQRGGSLKLSARIHERIQNRRKDRNHKLSRRLVAENKLIVFSADIQRSMTKTFGKSINDSAHYQLRRMLAYKSKCRTDGLGVYVEVPSRNSTKTCSACGALSGPTGLAGLKVRQWKCVACGAEHDRDVNAAVNTLIAGIGAIHEMPARAA